MLADTEDRMDWLRMAQARAATSAWTSSSSRRARRRECSR